MIVNLGMPRECLLFYMSLDRVRRSQLPGMTGPPNSFTARGPVTQPFCFHSQLCKNDTPSTYQKTQMP